MTKPQKVFFLVAFLVLFSLSAQRWMGLQFLDEQKNLLFLNGTASLPIGLYMAIPTIEYRNGDIIAFRDKDMAETAIKNGWLPKGEENIVFLKHIALPGTVYSLDKDGSFSVGGEYIGIVAKDDGKGHDLPQLPKGHHIVPPNHFLAYTKEQNSYDGRYIGVIPMDKIIHRVIPIITK